MVADQTLSPRRYGTLLCVFLGSYIVSWAGCVRGFLLQQTTSRRSCSRPPYIPPNHDNMHSLYWHSSAQSAPDNALENAEQFVKPSFYKTVDKNNRHVWKKRKVLSQLEIGEPLQGYVFQEHLEGVTGPKVFLEVGVGRYNARKHQWKIVHAMLRLGHRNSKASVTQKRAARLRKKTTPIDCFVSRIRTENGHLEVVLDEAEVPEKIEKKVSVSTLQPGQELVGTIVKLVPYGIFVDVGANRVGLLHIQKVADLYGTYIDKEKDLEEMVGKIKDKIKVQVQSSEKKRLFLDFTVQVKEEAELDRIERRKRKEEQKQEQEQQNKGRVIVGAAQTAVSSGTVTATVGTDAATISSTSQSSKEEGDSLAADSEDYESDDEEDDYDDYDEDRDIEDALGLGTY